MTALHKPGFPLAVRPVFIVESTEQCKMHTEEEACKSSFLQLPSPSQEFTKVESAMCAAGPLPPGTPGVTCRLCHITGDHPQCEMLSVSQFL
jgi:hypothetical protein